MLALLGAVIANLARDLVRCRVAALHEVTIARFLIAVGRSLIVIGRGLVAVGPRLIGIREGLLAIGERLIVLQRLGTRGDALVLSLDRPVRGAIRGTVA